jgi:hypothetical protein
MGPSKHVDKFYAHYLGASKGFHATPYISTGRSQKGAGLGSFLANVFRQVFPYIKSGAKAFGEEFLKSGVGVLQDNFKGKTLKDSLRDRVREAGNNLSERASKKVESMAGGGGAVIKRRRKRRSKHSATNSRKKRTSTKKKRKAPKRTKKKTKRRTKASGLKNKTAKKRISRKKKKRSPKKDIFC